MTEAPPRAFAGEYVLALLSSWAPKGAKERLEPSHTWRRARRGERIKPVEHEVVAKRLRGLLEIPAALPKHLENYAAMRNAGLMTPTYPTTSEELLDRELRTFTSAAQGVVGRASFPESWLSVAFIMGVDWGVRLACLAEVRRRAGRTTEIPPLSSTPGILFDRLVLSSGLNFDEVLDRVRYIDRYRSAGLAGDEPVDPSTLEKWRNGARDPAVESILAVAAAIEDASPNLEFEGAFAPMLVISTMITKATRGTGTRSSEVVRAFERSLEGATRAMSASILELASSYYRAPDAYFLIDTVLLGTKEILGLILLMKLEADPELEEFRRDIERMRAEPWQSAATLIAVERFAGVSAVGVTEDDDVVADLLIRASTADLIASRIGGRSRAAGMRREALDLLDALPPSATHWWRIAWSYLLQRVLGMVPNPAYRIRVLQDRGIDLDARLPSGAYEHARLAWLDEYGPSS